MFISRIVVQNFRNIRYLDISTQDGVTTFIGENNTGKTNLMHALRLVLDADMPAYARSLSQSDVHAAAYQHPFQVLVSIEFSDFETSEDASAFAGFMKVDEDLARLTYRFRPNAKIRGDIESGETAATDLTFDDYRWEITGGGQIDPADITWDQDSGSGIRLGFLSDYLVMCLPAIRDASSDLRSPRHSPLRKVVRNSDIGVQEQEALLTALRNANERIAASASITAIGTRLADRLEATAGGAFQMEVGLGMAKPTFEGIEKTLMLLLSSDGHAEFDVAENGLGMNNILYLAILLEYFHQRLESGSVAGSLLLVEEPEAHLHPQLERVVFETLRRRGVQVFVTSHSSHIASSSKLEDIAVFTKMNDGTISAHSPKANEALGPDEQRDLERYLDATKSTLLFARRVILVEGPAEMFVIPGLVKSVMNIDLERQGIAVIPIYGTHFSAFAKLFGPDAIRKRCAILTDRDGVPGDEPPRGLGQLENDYVRVFATENTFEMSLAIPGLRTVLENTANDFNARTLSEAIEQDDNAELQRRILRCAEDRGKGRFAQVLARHLTDATDLPNYIRQAIDWIIQ